MSYFGHDNFKQEILDEIGYAAERRKLSKPEAAAQVAEVLAYLCETAFSRDEEMARVKAEAKEEARRELVAKLAS